MLLHGGNASNNSIIGTLPAGAALSVGVFSSKEMPPPAARMFSHVVSLMADFL